MADFLRDDDAALGPPGAWLTEKIARHLDSTRAAAAARAVRRLGLSGAQAAQAFAAFGPAWRQAQAGGDHPPSALPGYLCEICQDAPAVTVRPAPDGGEMGVCAACAAGPPGP